MLNFPKAPSDGRISPVPFLPEHESNVGSPSIELEVQFFLGFESEEFKQKVQPEDERSNKGV